ncbi:prostaglandin E synthase 2 [Neodiprion pinetum]|uniref:prostaglandin E synthase 2 n=1 Tax=Neodiprion pinetum TaxID=441929 RepID=UPI001EDF0337|nr:prostaglandin E synthase 2 [Neodiprion pinetum]
MSVIYKVSRFLLRNQSQNKNVHHKMYVTRHFQTATHQAKPPSVVKMSLIGASVGVVLGAGYSFNKINKDRKNIANEGTQTEIETLKSIPDIKPSRKVIYPGDNSGLKLTLFQYQTCPFCCKVRVFLDYHGISYDVVEVDPVLRNEIKWSTYRKVPILLAKVDGGYQPLIDSTMIISVLGTILEDKYKKIEDIVKYYPKMFCRDAKGTFKEEIVNKYFLMYQNNLPKEKSMNYIVEERKWRKWADDVLVHVLSPNVYRTTTEARQAFNWFSDVGRWEEYFPMWERLLMINVGAYAMWLISKRLKKRHSLKDDVRQSLYDEVNHWLNGISVKGTQFMGGSDPDFSDLAVYGILKSIEGCEAFRDLLDHTKVGVWFNAMREKIDSNHGRQYVKY